LKIESDVGAVDMLINNAGIVSGKPFLELTEEQIRRTFAVNTLAHFWTLRAFLPGMVKRNKGVVVTISSAGGIVGTNGLADYSASKFAVYGMDESLRLDLRKQKSKVHTLCVTPFYINTGLFDGVKTKIPLLLPILEAVPVAKAIVDAIEAREHYLEIPKVLGLAWITKSLLPTV
jgi:all-trans-retinol dehydrogenase (NAD+)